MTCGYPRQEGEEKKSLEGLISKGNTPFYSSLLFPLVWGTLHISVWWKGPFSSRVKDCHFRNPSSQPTPSTWGVISEQTSLFGAGCFPFVTNCNGLYWELDVPTASLGRTFSLVARTVPLLSYGVWGSRIMNVEKDFAAFIRLHSWEAKQSRLCVKDVMLPGWFPCEVVSSISVHCCCIHRELLPNGATFSIRKGEYAKECVYQLSFTCMKNYIGIVAF